MHNQIVIIGLGYVGLPPAAAFAERYTVVRSDINEERMQELKNRFDRTLEPDGALLTAIRKRIVFSAKAEDIKDCQIYIVTVSTPIDASNRIGMGSRRIRLKQKRATIPLSSRWRTASRCRGRITNVSARRSPVLIDVKGIVEKPTWRL